MPPERDGRPGWAGRGHAYAASAVHRDGPSLARLLELARPAPTDRCLDIGTGAGHTAARLAPSVAEVVALDPEPDMLASARERYGHLANVRFVQAPGHATGLPDGSVDLVTARHTLHHHADPIATLREAARVMAPGGRLVLVDEVTPDPAVDAWFDALERARDATHVRAYTLAEWRAMLGAAGLRWVEGDAEVRYRMHVDAWVGRMAPSRESWAEVRRLFRAAGPLERRLFDIEFANGEAVRFAMPMAVVHAVRPPGGDREGDPT